MVKLFIIFGVIVCICIIEWIREILTFKVTHYQINSKKLNGMSKQKKIVFLSDLHNNQYGKNNSRLFNAIIEQAPDMILVGGDMLVGDENRSSIVAEKFVEQLVKICPVYYANGNHEQRLKIYPEKYGRRYQEYKDFLVRCGVHLLENDHVNFMWDKIPVQVHGLEIPREGYKKFKRTTISLNEISERIGEADYTKYQILLAHNPIYADTYMEWGADLILSGHLHGGIVRIPMIGGIITPQFRLFPKYSGELTKKNEKTVVVSKGLGTHTIRIRFLNPAEVVVLHVGGEEK